jgi:uncharacterized Zn-finger protein
VTAIDFHTDPVTAPRPRAGLLPTTVAGIPGIVPADNQTDGGYLKFKNDHGAAEIHFGVREFKCVGASPPRDHPHVYINMGDADTILCPYCGTRFRFDPRLGPLEAEPPGSVFAHQNAV